METIRGSIAIITNKAVLFYLLKGVAFTVMIALIAVVVGLLLCSVQALDSNYCKNMKLSNIHI
ncbi:MAG: amino acid ABC transporter permease, partial [Lachnospiraceae bacterium]